MKRLILGLLLINLISCTEMNQTQTQIAPITKERIANAVIYEANIRQYSPQGSFEAFTKDLPKLKELGVDIIWLMPIYPISTTKSKGTLGSYYAISDYQKVNPEFGDLNDVKALIDTAHELDMYVVLDWVPNHTGWDHIWLKEHPEWYTKDENGNPTHPVGTDWTDTADLNYDQQDMRAQMLEDMKYWISEVDIDGFRCDMAGMVPTDFWEHSIAELRAMKPIFMLAEAWEPHLIQAGFDMVYGWETHHLSNDIAKGHKSLNDFRTRMEQVKDQYAKDAILMNFTSNHDENSWNGSVNERLGEAVETAAALMYTIAGMPLIYSGQEYDLDRRLLFFEKDSIDRTKGHMFDVYKKLGKLKKATSALDTGVNPSSYTNIDNTANDRVLSFLREKEGDQLIYLANFSAEAVSVQIHQSGTYTDFYSRAQVNLEESIDLAPYAYQILLNN
jgi:glycosidase